MQAVLLSFPPVSACTSVSVLLPGKCRTWLNSATSWGLAATPCPQEAFLLLTHYSSLWLPPLYLYGACTFSHTCAKELNSAIGRGAYSINYSYASMDVHK